MEGLHMEPGKQLMGSVSAEAGSLLRLLCSKVQQYLKGDSGGQEILMSSQNPRVVRVVRDFWRSAC